MFKIITQLHGLGGGGGGSPQIKTSAPGSIAAATIDGATEGQRQDVRNRLARAKGRQYTNRTNGMISDTVQSVKKALLGE